MPHSLGMSIYLTFQAFFQLFSVCMLDLTQAVGDDAVGQQLMATLAAVSHFAAAWWAERHHN